MNQQAPTYKNHRFPISIVARAIWLYFRFNLRLREGLSCKDLRYSGFQIIGLLFLDRNIMDFGFMTISFKSSQYPKSVILHAVFFYVCYAVSYRDLQQILLERGIDVDHTILNRWVVKYSPLIAARARQRKASTSQSWRVDETYVRVKGR